MKIIVAARSVYFARLPKKHCDSLKLYLLMRVDDVRLGVQNKGTGCVF